MLNFVGNIFKIVIKRTFPVTGMSCASCASSVETILSHTAGVQSAAVNFASETVLVQYEETLDELELQKALQSVGFDMILDFEDPQSAQEEEKKKAYEYIKRRTLASVILTLPIFVFGMFYMHWELGKWISLALSIPVLFYFGKPFFIGAYNQTKKGTANMDTLVALSTGVAFIFSLFNLFFPSFWLARGIEPHVYFEAATVIITFISFGKLLEARAKSQTGSAIKKLMGMQAKTVHWISEDGEVELPVEQLQSGYVLSVLPGERIPADGRVMSGETYIDESTMTGESIPVSKQKGDKVYAGTLNQLGHITFKAEKVGRDTLLSQIIKTVQEAQGSKAPVQNLVDKVAAIFVPVVLLISVITFVAWWIWAPENPVGMALVNAISVLVIACPCALGLATPTALMVGMGKGAENQILIKDAISLEKAMDIDVVILDKTGTITEGIPVVNHWEVKADSFQLDAFYALEKKSEHPLAQAVLEHLKGNSTRVEISEFKSITGQGVEGVVNGEVYRIGNRKLMSDSLVEVKEEHESTAIAWEKSGQTVIFFAVGGDTIGIAGIADKIKVGSIEAINTLKRMGLAVHLLSGDNHRTTAAIAQELGLETFQGGAMPKDKSNYIKELQSQGKVVAMVGDGINDSEALALADVSIAMGKGSEIAMDVAHITLMNSDLRSVPKAFRLSRNTIKGIRQNLFWAFIYNVIGIPIAAGLLYPITGFLLDPMIAGAAMAFSSVSVVLNSLRIRI